MEIKQPKRVEKSWGYELWIHNEPDYCGKLLVFTKILNCFSMHYHMVKDETWYVQKGRFIFSWIVDGKLQEKNIYEGDVVEIKKGLPHQLTSTADESIIFEVSTQHFDDDSYRIYRKSANELL